MAKVKLTKSELKKQKEDLERFQRYLPMLELKRQQLQVEVQKTKNHLQEARNREKSIQEAIDRWVSLLCDKRVELGPLIKVKELYVHDENIAGVHIGVFEKITFEDIRYDLFATPLWIDAALEDIRKLISSRTEIKIIKETLDSLVHELLVTSQRVNLFSEIKIPEAKENIRVIRIYQGDQQVAAVARSKIAKKKIELLHQKGVA